MSAAQLLALRARDGGRCRFPGCSHTRHLHAHHIVSWLVGGPTDVDNLVLLCSAHHALVHDHGYRLRWTPTGTEFRRPDGALLPAEAPPLDAAPSVRSTRVLDDLAELWAPWPDTLTPTWSGERLDPDGILLRLVPAAARPAAA